MAKALGVGISEDGLRIRFAIAGDDVPQVVVEMTVAKATSFAARILDRVVAVVEQQQPPTTAAN